MDLCFCECPALALGLELHHVGEDTAFLQQLCGRTLLGYCTILEHHDLVRAGDSAHPVGDNEDSLVLNKSGKVPPEWLFRSPRPDWQWLHPAE